MDWMGIAWAEQHQGVQGLSRAHLAVHPLRHGRAWGTWPVGWENYSSMHATRVLLLHSNLFDHVLDNPTFRTAREPVRGFGQHPVATEAFIARMGAMTAKLEQPCPSTSRAGDLLREWTHGQRPEQHDAEESERVTTSRIHLIESFNLPFQRTVTLNATPNWAGDIRVNTIVPAPTLGRRV